ncbi:ATP synthase F1 subunit gamma [Geosporobacter ferrireducens]|uniref:ATP synthase gamma chain n=1 Tax=Geosporobacter ferrireducens TaxID=1424294 RepID=A0A1D8GGM2_9FIRM|nr:ATP synthase F1 subunit gamma [Geosporobacter ferrireducens]AOT70072.1 ATP synthase F1 subunit gamma [Geosporobacter ferrireducens]MTI53380.1 ATP synthase F1 subunit gamma [Geosporobacter ferrireducens]
MAGMGMRDVKRRIKSVNSTKQITKAMELVSSAKLRRARQRVEKTRPYFNTIKETVQDIFSSTGGIKHPFVSTREIKKTCYIVITGDRGLSGGYNANVIKTAVTHMAEKQAKSVIAIGTKGRDYFRSRKYDLDGEFLQISEDPSYGDAKRISSLVLQLYENKLIDEVYLVYTQFVSTISQKPEMIKLLPLSGEKKAKQEEKEFEYVSYEPSPEAVLDYLVPKYIESTIFGALVESSASEQGARRVAMENATDNAEEMIDDLTLLYNRARQAAITQEIAEIVGGAEALK